MNQKQQEPETYEECTAEESSAFPLEQAASEEVFVCCRFLKFILIKIIEKYYFHIKMNKNTKNMIFIRV